MARYETNIGKVEGSTFAVGENAIAYGSNPIDPEYRDAAARLADLIDLISKYSNTTQDIGEIRDLAHEAQREVTSAQPDKQRIRRAVDRMQAALSKVGPGIISIGALADAVAKIAGAIPHV